MDDRAGFCRVRVKFRFGLGRRDAISCKRVPLRKGSARVQLKVYLVRRDAISLKAFPSGLPSKHSLQGFVRVLHGLSKFNVYLGRGDPLRVPVLDA